MIGCEHERFQAKVDVNRLTKVEGGPVTGYVAEVTVWCLDCAKKFQFLGLEPGYDTQGARVSLDGLEANLALLPEGVKPNPFQRLAYNIRGFE